VKRSRKRTIHVAIAMLTAILAIVLLSVNAQGALLGATDVRHGRAIYIANCAVCHQLAGTGVKASVPPLSENVPNLLAQNGGRRYLLSALLNGVSGDVTVEGTTYDGLMPAWRHLSDSQLAAVLNYISYDWGNVDRLPNGTSAFTPFEVVAARTDAQASRAVASSRPATED